MSITTEITRLQGAKANLKTAIESKGVTVPSSATLDDYAALVDSISGGGDNTKYLNLIARSGASFEDSDVETTGRNAFAFWTAITTLSLPNLKTLGDGCFQGCSGITNFYFPNVTKIAAGNTFNGAGTTTSAIVLPKLASYPSANALNSFRGKYIDLGATIVNINSYMFGSDTNLNVLILRKTSIAPLVNVNAFNSTPFKSGGAGGTIYIPKVLYDHLGDGTSLDYKAATNWSTVDGYGTITWAKIEGSQYESYYADGTPITT